MHLLRRSIMLSGILVLFKLCVLSKSSLLLFHNYGENSDFIFNKKQKNFSLFGDAFFKPMSVLPPNLPVRFYNKFELYYTPRDDPNMPLPPWPNTVPPKLPYAVGRGMTWYAQDLNIAIELYLDYCVPIFEPTSYFPCKIFNFNHTAYLISPISSGYGPCCVYRKPWEIPKRNYMQHLTKYFHRTTHNFGHGVFNQSIDWWIIPNDSKAAQDANHPVFGGYGWTSHNSKKLF